MPQLVHSLPPLTCVTEDRRTTWAFHLMIQAPWRAETGVTRLNFSGLLAAAATKPIRFKVPEERVGAIINRIGWNPGTPPSPEQFAVLSTRSDTRTRINRRGLCLLSAAFV